jgi:putative endonuclease
MTGRKGSGMPKGGYTYILTNKPRGVLYIGVTADLSARMVQHREGKGSAFARRYGLDRLVLIEHHDSIEEAIAREKALKAWQRAWKIELIERANPTWRDLFEDINR